jgi:hypothetical protein
MDILQILKIFAALATAAAGLLAFVKPGAISSFTGITANGVRGISEIRAIFGGLFIAIGLVPLFLGAIAYHILGIGYLAIAVARLFSIFFDKSYSQSNWYSLAVEVVSGIILVI